MVCILLTLGPQEPYQDWSGPETQSPRKGLQRPGVRTEDSICQMMGGAETRDPKPHCSVRGNQGRDKLRLELWGP